LYTLSKAELFTQPARGKTLSSVIVAGYLGLILGNRVDQTGVFPSINYFGKHSGAATLLIPVVSALATELLRSGIATGDADVPQKFDKLEALKNSAQWREEFRSWLSATATDRPRLNIAIHAGPVFSGTNGPLAAALSDAGFGAGRNTGSRSPSGPTLMASDYSQLVTPVDLLHSLMLSIGGRSHIHWGLGYVNLSTPELVGNRTYNNHGTLMTNGDTVVSEHVGGGALAAMIKARWETLLGSLPLEMSISAGPGVMFATYDQYAEIPGGEVILFKQSDSSRESVTIARTMPAMFVSAECTTPISGLLHCGVYADYAVSGAIEVPADTRTLLPPRKTHIANFSVGVALGMRLF
jgi:hypothetical protein